MHFGPDYRETLTLRDGTPVVLRAIRPDDKAMLHPGRIAADRMKSECEIAAIIVPRVADGVFRTSRISPRIANLA